MSERPAYSYVVHYLSDRYMPMIRLMVYQMGGTLEDAKDIFQDGLIIMLEKIDNNNFVLTCKFKTFLYCVCENLWKSVYMKRQSAKNYLSRMSKDEYGDEKDFTEHSDIRLYEKIIHDVFVTLNPVSQKILKLYWQEMSPKEVADSLGYTYGYVRKKKCEGQSELIEKVKRHPDYKRIMDSENITKYVVH